MNTPVPFGLFSEMLAGRQYQLALLATMPNDEDYVSAESLVRPTAVGYTDQDVEVTITPIGIDALGYETDMVDFSTLLLGPILVVGVALLLHYDDALQLVDITELPKSVTIGPGSKTVEFGMAGNVSAIDQSLINP